MLPYPLLAISLVITWLLLNGWSIGHLILGSIVGVFASWGMATLRPDKPRLRKWYLLPKLFGIVMIDIIRSNIGVAKVVLKGRDKGHYSGFINISLDLEDPTALAILAVIITGTPGSAWLEYDSRQKSVLIHVLDLIDEDAWRALIKNRYEKLLLEIFE